MFLYFFFFTPFDFAQGKLFGKLRAGTKKETKKPIVFVLMLRNVLQSLFKYIMRIPWFMRTQTISKICCNIVLNKPKNCSSHSYSHLFFIFLWCSWGLKPFVDIPPHRFEQTCQNSQLSISDEFFPLGQNILCRGKNIFYESTDGMFSNML